MYLIFQVPDEGDDHVVHHDQDPFILTQEHAQNTKSKMQKLIILIKIYRKNYSTVCHLWHCFILHLMLQQKIINTYINSYQECSEEIGTIWCAREKCCYQAWPSYYAFGINLLLMQK